MSINRASFQPAPHFSRAPFPPGRPISKASFSSLRWHRKAREGARPTHTRPPSSRANRTDLKGGADLQTGKEGPEEGAPRNAMAAPQPQPERRTTSPEVGPTPNVRRRKGALLGRGVEATVWRARLDSGRGDVAALAPGPQTTHLRGRGCPRQLLSPLHAQASAWWVSAQLLGCRRFPASSPRGPSELLCLQTSCPPSLLPLFSPVA